MFFHKTGQDRSFTAKENPATKTGFFTDGTAIALRKRSTIGYDRAVRHHCVGGNGCIISYGHIGSQRCVVSDGHIFVDDRTIANRHSVTDYTAFTNKHVIESPRVYRRLFCVSQAATA